LRASGGSASREARSVEHDKNGNDWQATLGRELRSLTLRDRGSIVAAPEVPE
jgi:hypothetical protein